MQLHVSHFWGVLRSTEQGWDIQIVPPCVFTVRKWGEVDRNVKLLCVTVWVYFTPCGFTAAVFIVWSSPSLSLFFREVLIRPRGTIEQQCNTNRGHRSYQPLPNEVYRQIPKYRRHCMLGYAWEHFKNNFLLGFYWHPGECDWNFKLYDQLWALSENFTMSWFLQTCLRSVLLQDNVRASSNMKYDKKRLLSHSGYVSKYEDKRNIQWWFHLGESSGKVHLHSGLFLFSLSLLRAVVSLSYFLCWEICRNVLFTVLKPVILFLHCVFLSLLF